MSYSNLWKARHSAFGREYLVTTVTFQRAPIFTSFRDARTVCAVLRETQDEGLTEWLAWVIMPDHLHALLRLDGTTDLSALMRTVKGRAAKRIRRDGGSGRVWQPHFHDHALRREEDRLAAARYIIANPVRAGLVARVGDYPHWDCVWL